MENNIAKELKEVSLKNMQLIDNLMQLGESKKDELTEDQLKQYEEQMEKVNIKGLKKDLDAALKELSNIQSKL